MKAAPQSASPFRRLLKMFQERFFENDTVAQGGGFETNIYQVMAGLMTLSFFVTYLSLGAFVEFTFPGRMRLQVCGRFAASASSCRRSVSR